MKEWLLSIVGIAFLGVLIDILYPSGKTGAFCKSIFGIISMLVILGPLFDIKIGDSDSVTIDSDMWDSINDIKINVMCDSARERLRLKGIDGVDVELVTKMEDNEIVIENVYIDTTNLVLTENITNINKYEVVSREVGEIFDISTERIIVYG